MEPFCVIDFLNPFMPDVEMVKYRKTFKTTVWTPQGFKNMFGNFSIMDGMVE